MKTLYLMRHGQTGFNSQARYCGRTDVPLSAAGEDQARRLRGRMEGVEIDAAYSSDLARAYRTAGIVCEGRGVRVGADALLRELDFGQWEGLTFEEISARYGQTFAAWIENPAGVSPTGGESLSDLCRRVNRFLEGVLAGPGESIAVVSHSGPIRALLCGALGVAPAGFWSLAIEPASLSAVAYHGTRACVHLVNDTCHLVGAGRSAGGS